MVASFRRWSSGLGRRLPRGPDLRGGCAPRAPRAGHRGPGEGAGRRRRTLSLAQAGRDTLARWLTGPAEHTTDVRDEGLRFETPQAASLAFGLRFEELAVAFWTEVAEHGVSAVDPRPQE
ncbi:hypothetical protein [Streptomyces sp. NPDC048057]|uniref:hypothetical protein n=1 Tax=Streptomyces sp. NPDC048057 TaxID=3155628 RepID=UPI0034008465